MLFPVIAGEAASPEASGTFSIILLVVMGLLFYLFLIRPQRRRVAAMRDLHQSLEVGNDIRTIGGMVGTITAIDDDLITVDVGGGTRIQFTRQAVAEVRGASS